jgi:hypothetical protein
MFVVLPLKAQPLIDDAEIIAIPAKSSITIGIAKERRNPHLVWHFAERATEA